MLNRENKRNVEKYLTYQEVKALFLSHFLHSTYLVWLFKIQQFLDDTVQQNPAIASSYVAGLSYEKRNLKVLVLKTAQSKSKVWLDCGIHAVILLNSISSHKNNIELCYRENGSRLPLVSGSLTLLLASTRPTLLALCSVTMNSISCLLL